MNKNFWESTYINNYTGDGRGLSDKLVEYIHTFTNEDSVLDYGGGSGRITAYINKLYPKARIHLYDTSFTAIQNSYKDLLDNPYITRSFTNFLPQYNYTKIIMHRVLHNMMDAQIDLLFNQLSYYVNNNSTIFISVKSKNCPKYTDKLNNNKFVFVDNGFYNQTSNRYVKFYSLTDLNTIMNRYQIKIKESGEIIEDSFRNKINNKYLYIYGQYNKTL